MDRDYFVYIVRCSDGSYYTGITNNYEERVMQHNAGDDTSCYTFSRRPVELVYIASFQQVLDAIAWEKQVKRWSRKKKEALIRKEFEKLPALSKRRKPFPKKPPAVLRDGPSVSP